MDDDELRNRAPDDEVLIRTVLFGICVIGALVVLGFGIHALQTGSMSHQQSVETPDDRQPKTPREPVNALTWEEAGFSAAQAKLLDLPTRTPEEQRRLSIMQSHHEHDYAASVTTESTYNEKPVTADWTFDPNGRYQMAVFKVHADIDLENRGAAIADLLMNDCPGYLHAPWFSDEISKALETQLPQRWATPEGYQMSIMVSSPLDVTVTIAAEAK